MNPIFRMAFVAAAVAVTAIPEAAFAQAGRVHRATRRRTAVVVSSAVRADEAQDDAAAAAAAQQSTAAQQSATAQQQSATAAQQSATAAQQTAAAQQAAKPAGGALPTGTVASALPAGCTASTVGGVEYHQCGANWYRSAFQGNNLVYVTTPAPQ
jgi:hypothetical protein